MHQGVLLPLASNPEVGRAILRPTAARATADIEQAGMTVLLVSASLAGSVMMLILIVRQRDQAKRDSARDVYELVFPRDLTTDQVTAFVRALVELRIPHWSLLGRPSVAFEIVARGQALEHRLRLPRDLADDVLAQLRASAPGVRTTAVGAPVALPRRAV